MPENDQLLRGTQECQKHCTENRVVGRGDLVLHMRTWQFTQSSFHRFKNFVYTYRIFKDGRGFYNIQTVEGAPQMLFSNLKELISTFEKPNQGLVVQLRHPIKQASSRPRWRRSQIQLDSIYENSNSDYVEVLPWRQGDWAKQLQKRWGDSSHWQPYFSCRCRSGRLSSRGQFRLSWSGWLRTVCLPASEKSVPTSRPRMHTPWAALKLLPSPHASCLE